MIIIGFVAWIKAAVTIVLGTDKDVQGLRRTMLYSLMERTEMSQEQTKSKPKESQVHRGMSASMRYYFICGATDRGIQQWQYFRKN